jgi:hypothetical protein
MAKVARPRTAWCPGRSPICRAKGNTKRCRRTWHRNGNPPLAGDLAKSSAKHVSRSPAPCQNTRDEVMCRGTYHGAAPLLGLRSLFCSTRYCGAESTPMTIQIRGPRPDASRSRGSRRLHRAILSGIVQSVPQPQPATLAISNRLNGKVPVTSAKR